MAQPLTLQALGRPFGLGMLYDVRRDQLIPGITLWNPDALNKDRQERRQPYTHVDVEIDQGLDDKASRLDVEANLKLSFLCGMVTVEGSAKYLTDKRSTTEVSRITLVYKSTSQFMELTMAHLGKQNITYPEVFDDKSATHVVSAILYGANACFTFEKTLSKSEDRTEVSGNMKAMVKKIPTFSIEGEAALDFTEKQKAMRNKLSCSIHGDFELRSNPTTFDEALQIYKDLHIVDSMAVPIQVWLLPLSELDSRAARLVRQISDSLVQTVSEICEQIRNNQLRCKDMMKGRPSEYFNGIKSQVAEFDQLLGLYDADFKKKLVMLLPRIRGGDGATEANLVEVIETHRKCPFHVTNLNKWLDSVEGEAIILDGYISLLGNVQFLTERALNGEIIKTPELVCLFFHCPPVNINSVQLFKAMRSNLDGGNQPYNTGTIPEKLLTPKGISKELRDLAAAYGTYRDVNKDVTCFLTTGEDGKGEVKGSITVYRNSAAIINNFKPPNRPTPGKIASAEPNKSITVEWLAPTYGAEFVKGYRITYAAVDTPDLWKHVDTGSTQLKYTIYDWSMTSMSFRVQAVCEVGLSPESLKPDDSRCTIL